MKDKKKIKAPAVEDTASPEEVEAEAPTIAPETEKKGKEKKGKGKDKKDKKGKKGKKRKKNKKEK